MNWLVIKSAAQINAAVASLPEQIVQKYKDEFADIINSDIPLDDETLKRLGNQFLKATHVLIIDETFAVAGTKSESQVMGQCMLLGMLMGRNIPVFSLSKACAFADGYFVRTFDSEEVMAASLNDNYKTLQLTELREDSLKDLMNRGIPFTPDSFATYIAKDKIDICRQFFDAGMDINCRDSEGTSMLNVAVRAEVPKIVSWLLRRGANINSVSKDRGYTAVMDAVWKKNLEIATMLVVKGADLSYVSKEGQSILVLAVGIGDVEMCRLLVEHGADPDIKDGMGMSAYEYATLFKKTDLVEVLAPYHRERL